MAPLAKTNVRMLISFKISNYLSFKDEITLSLRASAIKEYAETNVFEPAHQDCRLVKSAVLYGHNSAGKSNLIKGLEFMRRFVLTSAKDTQANELIEAEPFKLSATSTKKPCCFEVEFINDNRRYRYGFHTTKERITKESLYEIRPGKDAMLFERLYDRFMVNLKEAGDLERKTRSNALFLSVMAQWNVPLAIRVLKWFQNLLFLNDLAFKTYFNHTVALLADENKKHQLLKILKVANLGFENLEIRKFKIEDQLLADLPDEVKKVLLAKSSEKPQILALHRKFNDQGVYSGVVPLSLTDEESLGTQKYFAFSGYILDVLLQGGVLIIDELDARLHPLLALLIVQFFNSSKDNALNAQLIFSTHNTNLLADKVLRRDQIFFVNKNDFGASNVYSINDLGIRNDASFEKEYLKGEYDAVPYKEPPQLNLFEDDNRLTLF